MLMSFLSLKQRNCKKHCFPKVMDERILFGGAPSWTLVSQKTSWEMVTHYLICKESKIHNFLVTNSKGNYMTYYTKDRLNIVSYVQFLQEIRACPLYGHFLYIFLKKTKMKTFRI